MIKKTLTIQDRIFKEGKNTKEWACYIFGVFKGNRDKGNTYDEQIKFFIQVDNLKMEDRSRGFIQ